MAVCHLRLAKSGPERRQAAKQADLVRAGSKNTELSSKVASRPQTGGFRLDGQQTRRCRHAVMMVKNQFEVGTQGPTLPKPQEVLIFQHVQRPSCRDQGWNSPLSFRGATGRADATRLGASGGSCRPGAPNRQAAAASCSRSGVSPTTWTRTRSDAS